MLYNFVYMNKKTKMNTSEYMMLAAGAIVIMLIGFYDLDMHYCLTIINDEFSYWANAAQMAGKDWTSLLSTSSFYSYGYSLLLVPLFWLGISMSAVYRIAIAINVLMLVGSFFMASWLGMQLFGRGEGLISRRIVIFISLVVTLYTGNIFQLTVAWTEIPLYFIFWAITVLIYRIIQSLLLAEKPRYSDVILLAAASVYIYTIHNRALGVMATALALVFFFYVKSVIEKKPQHRLLICLLLAAGLFVCVTLFRGYIIEAWFGNNNSISTNDYSGMVSKAARLNRFSAIFNLLYSISGKVFYQAVSSFLLVLLPVITAIGMTFQAIFQFFTRKKRKIMEKWNAEKWVLLFIAVAFGLEIGIAALFKSHPIETLRAIDVLYGRYPEFVNGPLLLFALAMLLMKRKLVKEALISLGVFIVCAVSVGYQLHNVKTMFLNINNAPAVYSIFKNLESPLAITLYMTFVGLGGFLLIFACLVFTQMKPPKKWKESKADWVRRDIILVTASVICLYWCVNGINISHNWVMTNGTRARESMVPIEEAMKRLPDETEIYYVMPPYDDLFNFIKIYQSLDPDRKVHLIYPDEMMTLKGAGKYVYMSRGVEIRNDMVFLMKTEGLEVFAELDGELFRYWLDNYENMPDFAPRPD
jgi:hypothetical protein